MINVLQLAAGKGSRFADYSDLPKPFINVDGMPMFKRAFESLGLQDVRYHILFQQEHVNLYNPKQYVPTATIHTIDYYTDGAATSANYVISNSEYKIQPWLIIDCDFIIDWDMQTLPACSAVFVEEHAWDVKSSYSKIDQDGNISCVAEKQPISQYRNTGHYYWETGNLFCESYNFYKTNDIRILNEFYISPLYNYAIQTGHKVKPVAVNKYLPIGTPADLEKYLNEKDSNI